MVRVIFLFLFLPLFGYSQVYDTIGRTDDYTYDSTTNRFISFILPSTFYLNSNTALRVNSVTLVGGTIYYYNGASWVAITGGGGGGGTYFAGANMLLTAGNVFYVDTTAGHIATKTDLALRELLSNKVTSFASPNNTTYPTTAAVNNILSSYLLANDSGANSGYMAYYYAVSHFVTAVSGTANRITSTGGLTPQIDISSSYVGQSSITNLGIITNGTWQGTAVADGFISSAATWNAKQNALGFTPENVANKATSFSTLNNTLYPSTLAVSNYISSFGYGTGSVTSVIAGTGLSGGTITTTGTISMPNTGTAGTYGSATQSPVFTTDAQGRITTVTNTLITPAFPNLTSIPTTIAGYGITDAYTKTASDARYAPISVTGTVTNVIAGINISVTGTSTIQPTINISGIIGTGNGGTGATTATSINATPIIYGINNSITVGTGTVTSVSTGTGLTGGPVTTSGTISLANTAVTAAAYTYGSFTVDAQGRITAASSNVPVTSVIAGTGLNGGTITSTGTISMPNVGTAGTYGSATNNTVPIITTDAQGRVSAVSTYTVTSSGGGVTPTSPNAVLYDSAGYIGGDASKFSWDYTDSLLNITNRNLGSSVKNAFVLSNPTPATSSVQQNSPAYELDGHVYDNTTSSDKIVGFRLSAASQAGFATSNFGVNTPASILSLDYNLNGIYQTGALQLIGPPGWSGGSPASVALGIGATPIPNSGYSLYVNGIDVPAGNIYLGGGGVVGYQYNLGQNGLTLSGNTKISIAGGANTTLNDVALSSGTVTVSNTSVVTGDKIQAWYTSGTALSIGLGGISTQFYVPTITSGTSFVINALTAAGVVNTTDNSTVTYLIIHKN